MARKRKQKRPKRYASPLGGHRRERKQLLPPWLSHDLKMAFTRWIPERMPDFLWAHDLLSHYDASEFHGLLDYLATFMKEGDKEHTLDGTLSALDWIPAPNRDKLIDSMPGHLRNLVGRWTHIAKLYPDMPGRWLFGDRRIRGAEENLEYSIGLLKRLTTELFPWREQPAALVNLFMIARLAKAGRFKTFSKEMVEGFAGYPNLPEDERKKTEARIRAIALGLYGFGHKDLAWAQVFYRQNFKISVCEFPKRSVPAGTRDQALAAMDEIRSAAVRFEADQRDALQEMSLEVALDLWAPHRQEVLLGLLSRQFSLAVAILGDFDMWQPHLGAHLLRHMAENLITVDYLEQQPELYEAFVDYGLGQLKLYKLQLQDAESLVVEDDPELSNVVDNIEEFIAAEINEEFLPINLGNWAGKNLREMAKDVNRDDLYRMVYHPRSLDAHSTWTSIASLNLQRCRNPLHRFHRVPVFHRTIPEVTLPFEALDLLVTTINRIAEALEVSPRTEPSEACYGDLERVWSHEPTASNDTQADEQ